MTALPICLFKYRLTKKLIACIIELFIMTLI